ncbi:MAG: hypothetical protein JWO89_2728, partial [Verrucomicrobiaceae bacterium]|nr:hypothetical protein [Verrucomicrobiaceae bacterium]
MSIYSVALRPELRFHSFCMSRRSTQAFSLLEALAMIVTLFVFGWLCVGVVRYDLKNQDEDPHASVKFTAHDIEEKARAKASKAEAEAAKAP